MQRIIFRSLKERRIIFRSLKVRIADVIKKYFRIERKLFTLETVREWISVKETNSGFVATVDLSVDSGKWLAWKLK